MLVLPSPLRRGAGGEVLKVLFSPYLPNILPSVYLYFFFVFCEKGIVDLAVDKFLSLGGQPVEIIDIDLFSDQHQVEVVGVAAMGKVAKQVGRRYIAQPGDDLFHQAVNPHVFAQDACDVAKQWMVAVGPEYLPVLLLARNEQSSLLKAVQLQPDGIGALAKLLRKAAQVSMHLGGQEKLGEHLQPGLPRNKQI